MIAILLIFFDKSETLMLLERNNVKVFFVDCLSFSAGEKSLDPRFVEIHVCLLACDVDFTVCHCIKGSVDSPSDLNEKRTSILLANDYKSLKTSYMKSWEETGFSLKCKKSAF